MCFVSKASHYGDMWLQRLANQLVSNDGLRRTVSWIESGEMWVMEGEKLRKENTASVEMICTVYVFNIIHQKALRIKGSQKLVVWRSRPRTLLYRVNPLFFGESNDS